MSGYWRRSCTSFSYAAMSLTTRSRDQKAGQFSKPSDATPCPPNRFPKSVTVYAIISCPFGETWPRISTNSVPGKCSCAGCASAASEPLEAPTHVRVDSDFHLPSVRCLEEQRVFGSLLQRASEGRDSGPGRLTARRRPTSRTSFPRFASSIDELMRGVVGRADGSAAIIVVLVGGCSERDSSSRSRFAETSQTNSNVHELYSSIYWRQIDSSKRKKISLFGGVRRLPARPSHRSDLIPDTLSLPRKAYPLII